MTGAVTGEKPEIVLDLSRLLSRLLHATPTGVDRVEMAYARGLAAMIPERLKFGAVNPAGRYGRLPTDRVLKFLDRTDALWSGAARPPTGAAVLLTAAREIRRMWPRRPDPPTGRRVLIQASPHHLDDERLTASILRREGAAFLCLLHDLIPITHPEYARPGGDATHLKRVETVARLADGVLTVSESTKRDFLPYLERTGRTVPVEAASLGVDPITGMVPQARSETPYFVCLGTIEPRKNHLLLLNIWRRLAETSANSADIPRLVIIGRRGWENENIVDMLDRCPALKGHVEETKRLPDREMAALLGGACALLMPSFAEGFGLPVAEAIAMGVPVICSDLPAHREAGGDVPLYLDPLDGPGWLRAIRAFATDGSAEAAAQAARRQKWRPIRWEDHLNAMLSLAERIAIRQPIGTTE